MHDRDKRTIYDVASEAGVAISTVSRVLNGSSEVSAATRTRVEEAIEKLQFRPQRTARTLAQKQTHSLAVAMPSFTSLFYVEVLKGIKDELRDHDTDLLLCNLGSTAPYQTLYRFLNRGAVDALILTSLPVDEQLERELLKLHAPVVLLGTRNEHFDAFAWDDLRGAEVATRHLVERGHTSIGMITAHPWSYSTDGRIQGYRRGLEAGGLAFDPSLIVTGETTKHAGFSEEAGYEGMQKLLQREVPPTAVFVTSDVKAFGAWSAARNAGIRVPEDVALIGYDNLKLSRYLGLSTMDQRMYDVGRRATARLVERMREGTGNPIQEEITPALIARRSSGSGPYVPPA